MIHCMGNSRKGLTSKIYLISRCFKPNQPQKTVSRKKYTVESTSKAEIKLGEQSEKAESRREHLWNEIQLKGP